MFFFRKRSWDFLNEVVVTEVLSVYFKEEDFVQFVFVVDSRNRWEDDFGFIGDGSGEMVDEDAVVAEVLAVLEAAIVGEDVDEVDQGRGFVQVNKLVFCGYVGYIVFQTQY